jgi:tetratricopeptide (TPR) repeat protein
MRWCWSKNYEKAVPYLEESTKLNPHDVAIDVYKQAIRINPDYVKAYYNLGVAYLGLGDKSSALDEYKVLNELDKESADTLFKLINKFH